MISIRKAIKSDVQVIYDLRSRAIIEKCSAYYSKEQLALWTQGGVSDVLVQDIIETFYVSETDGRIIGSGKLNTETGMVDAIFVEPEYFGRGAAKQMLAFIEKLGKKHGLSLLRLESTLNAAPFYRSCGFIGDKLSTYNSPRGICLDCIPMEKSLVKYA
ncbi:GNAT family N-acetyltransferase [Photobacterium phosphoreum]|uniref:GNAT family N-acetyltransferase n=1 Tax=Photobacterium phosphoreum TaxID=659 RepID=UPI001E2A6429|nr:GNAT family N-acetyltransferase [Photobacterium phosphoreum]MCD9481578.1 GNAT family N-acetyltransferase [Photobacterium phosphoreum]